MKKFKFTNVIAVGLIICSYNTVVAAQETAPVAGSHTGELLKFPVYVWSDDAPPKCISQGTTLKHLNTVGSALTYRVKDVAEGSCQKINGTWEPTKITSGEKVTISETIHKNNGAKSIGITYGALVIPFKYHLTGGKQFTGESTVGPYVGYKWDVSYVEVTGIGFLGASNISVAQNVNGRNTTQNLAGISYGFGLIGTIDHDFHMGVVLGWDHVNSSADYQYNNKPWVAAEIGFAFSK